MDLACTQSGGPPPEKLLRPGERVVVVDDDPLIRELLARFLQKQNLALAAAVGDGDEFRKLPDKNNIALVLLDIALPDGSGIDLLRDIVREQPDCAVVMLSGIHDISVAVGALRLGADDYLAKPVQLEELAIVIQRALGRRRMLLERREYQEELEKAQFHILLLHQLSQKMNSAYLSATELDDVLNSILIGITAEEGLRFNRAFLLLFDRQDRELRGALAIGVACREEAARVWSEIRDRHLSFLDIIKNINNQECGAGNAELNRRIRDLSVSADRTDHVLIRAATDRRSIVVEQGAAQGVVVPEDLIRLLDEDCFVVVPLFSPEAPLGVIIADNYVTRIPIGRGHISALEIFASQASLVIEHHRLRQAMREKIRDLEALTRELDKNKDLLVESGRYSALGQMAAQMMHSIQNPVTVIGGMTRLLKKKLGPGEAQGYLDVIVREASRLESTLGDLFDFVIPALPRMEPAHLTPVILGALTLLQTSIDHTGIRCEIALPQPGPLLRMDVRQLQLLFVHLLKNAVEAMDSGGVLSVSLEETDGRVTVRLADTGPGVSDADQQQARAPFFSTKSYGAGLGLSVVERIVKAHGGDFQLLRRKEQGMEAVVVLPVLTAAETPG